MTKVLIANIKGPKGDSATPENVLELVEDALEEIDVATSSDLETHIEAERPHQQAESGKNFAAWFNAQIA